MKMMLLAGACGVLACWVEISHQQGERSVGVEQRVPSKTIQKYLVLSEFVSHWEWFMGRKSADGGKKCSFYREKLTC